MKATQKEHFRWAAHTGGVAMVKQKDYELSDEFEALTPYALWKRLAEENGGRDALAPGDLLEATASDGAGALLIAKYIGFEPAEWFIPEPKNISGDPPFSPGSESINARLAE